MYVLTAHAELQNPMQDVPIFICAQGGQSCLSLALVPLRCGFSMITARREIRPIKLLPASNVICFHSNVTNTHVTASGIAYKNTVSKTLSLTKKKQLAISLQNTSTRTLISERLILILTY